MKNKIIIFFAIYLSFLSLAASAEGNAVRIAEDTVPRCHFTRCVFAMLTVIVLLILLLRCQKCREKENEQDRLTDKLTGMGNEKYIEKMYSRNILSSDFSSYYIAYIAIEIRRIEKYLGTTATEVIQRYAADIISESAAETEYAARINDGVFVFAFHSGSEESAGRRIEEILNRLNSYEDRFPGNRGILFRAGIFHMDSAKIPYETVLFNARQGYNYAARNKILLSFADSSAVKNEMLKTEMQKNLMHAVKNKEFKLYIQFVVDANTGVITGAEALSRWHSKNYGLVMPGQYIRYLQNAGVIDRLDFYMLEECCRQLELWKNTEKEKLEISCNFTRLTIARSDFSERLSEIVNRYDFDTQKLIIELTEDSLIDDKAAAYQNVIECKKMGFKIALDDLGSGYSSFSDLCDYPIDIIKIDRHIVAKSTTPRGKALLCAIVKFAHSLGIKVVCEGVETDSENINAKLSECDFIQGYYYSRVLSADEGDAFYSEYGKQQG